MNDWHSPAVAGPVAPAVEVAVGGVVVRGGTLLLVRRGRGLGAGKWSLPGGRVEFGESLAEALTREMVEETGLAVAVGPLCGIAERRAETTHYVILDYWCAVRADAVPSAGDDAAAITWADRAALERLELVPHLLDFLAEHAVLDRLR